MAEQTILPHSRRRKEADPGASGVGVVSAFLFPLLLLACAGCAYSLGPTNGLAAGEKSVQVRPFSNHTFEPRLADAVTAQVRKQLQLDGTYQLATHGDGDIVVTGIITRYDRGEMDFSRNDVLRVRDYRVTMTAQVTARERITGKVLLDQPVTGVTLVRVGSDLVSAERQALPLLAANLAQNLTALLADGKW
jgi:hypothetical protein